MKILQQQNNYSKINDAYFLSNLLLKEINKRLIRADSKLTHRPISHLVGTEYHACLVCRLSFSVLSHRKFTPKRPRKRNLRVS